MGYELYLKVVIKLTTKSNANVAIVKGVMEQPLSFEFVILVMLLPFEFYPLKALQLSETRKFLNPI